MDQQYQPLFNRTYLKIVPWIVAIVIVLLTARSQNGSSSFYETLEDNWIYLSIDKEIQHDQLKLVYPLSPAYSEQQIQQRIALQTSFGQTLHTQQNITAQWYDDKLILTILMPSDNTTAQPLHLKTLLGDLTRSASQFYPQALQQATAERYLALNTIDELALSNLKAQLVTSSTLIAPDSAIFDNRPTALLILKEKNASLSRIVSEQLKKHYPFSALRSTTTAYLAPPSRISLRHRGPSYLYLIGQPIPANSNSSGNMSSSKISRSLAFHYINQSIKNIANNQLSHYRLLLRPATPVGYAALLMTQNKPFKASIVSNLKTYLLEQLNDETLEQLKDRLVTQYSDQLANTEKRADLLASALFSAEKFQSSDEFHDTLVAITTQQIQAHIQQMFDPERAIIVTISPL